MINMIGIEYLSISEFADKAGVSKQAIYKQINNSNSQIAPYLIKDGKRTLIKATALSELYKVDIENSTFTTSTEQEQTTYSTPTVEENSSQSIPVDEKSQPVNPVSTPENQPLSTDYIDFLKSQIAELKAEKADIEKRLNATIAEKDNIIKDQSFQLSQLAKQVASIADRALVATSQQQYLTAMEKEEKKNTEPTEAVIISDNQSAVPKKGFLSWFFK